MGSVSGESTVTMFMTHTFRSFKAAANLRKEQRNQDRNGKGVKANNLTYNRKKMDHGCDSLEFEDRIT